MKSKRYNSSLILITLNILLLVFAFTFFQRLKVRKKPFNLIIISVDALRPDHMGIYGYNKNTTPNIDKFFKDAFIFNNVYTSTPKTYASMVSLMTGLEPATTKIFDYTGRTLRNNEMTLAEILKQYGYANGAFVMNPALFSSRRLSPSNLNKGFDRQDYLRVSEKINFISPDGTSDKSNFYHHKDQSEFVQKGLRFIKSNKNKKFFLWFHFIDPHAPYAPPYTPYDSEIYPQNKYQVEKIRQQLRGQANGCSYPFLVEKKLQQKYIKLYDADIKYSDYFVGKIFNQLNKLNLKTKTFVILLSDHGEGFDHNYNFQHGTLYQSNVKIPLLIYYPKLTGSKLNLLIHNSDITPTILDFMGIKTHYKFEGISFRPVFRNFQKLFFYQKKIIYGYNHDLKYFSIIDGKYKYLFAKNPGCLYSGTTEELYNLEKDPQELNNLVIKQPVIKKMMREKLLEHLRKKNLLKKPT